MGSDVGSWDGESRPRRAIRVMAKRKPDRTQHSGRKRLRRRRKRSSEEEEEDSEEEMGERAGILNYFFDHYLAGYLSCFYFPLQTLISSAT